MVKTFVICALLLVVASLSIYVYKDKYGNKTISLGVPRVTIQADKPKEVFSEEKLKQEKEALEYYYKEQYKKDRADYKGVVGWEEIEKRDLQDIKECEDRIKAMEELRNK